MMAIRAILYNAPESELERVEHDAIEPVREHIRTHWLDTLDAGDMIKIEEI